MVESIYNYYQKINVFNETNSSLQSHFPQDLAISFPSMLFKNSLIWPIKGKTLIGLNGGNSLMGRIHI